MYDPITVYERSEDFVDDYLRVFARPDQLEAWRKGERFVADALEQSVNA